MTRRTTGRTRPLLPRRLAAPGALRTAAAAGVLVLLAGGCSAVQESLECPGDHCPRELQDVADAAGSVAGVTTVDRAWRFSNLDKGSGGGLDVHASVSTRQEARGVALRLRALYAGSEVDPVDVVSVRVVPDPERSQPADQEVVAGGDVAPGEEPSCAADRCARQVTAFQAAFQDALRDASAGDPLAQGTTLGKVAWVPSPDDWKPQTRIKVDASDRSLDAAAFRDVERRIVEIAKDSGLTGIGDVRARIHYQRRVDFSFLFRNAAR